VRKVALLLVGLMACSAGPDVIGPDSSFTEEPFDIRILSGRNGMSLSVMPVNDRRGFLLQAPGFLSLRTFRRSGDIWLWPDDDALPVRYTRFLVYGGEENIPLRHLPSRIASVSLVPDEAIRAHVQALASLKTGAELFSSRNDTVRYAIDLVGAHMTVPVTVDADNGVFKEKPYAAAIARLRVNRQGTILDARIVIKKLTDWYGWENFMVAMAHEVAHVHGLLHLDPNGPQGIMSTRSDSYRFRDFTESEQLVIAMHDRRGAGTRLRGAIESETDGRFLSTAGGIGWISISD